MTPQEIRTRYEAAYLDPTTGRPWLGKFEGEPLYVPYFWNLALDGCGDTDWEEEGSGTEVEYTTLEIKPDDRAAFPELGTARAIRVWESDQGFVYHELLSEQEAAS